MKKKRKFDIQSDDYFEHAKKIFSSNTFMNEWKLARKNAQGRSNIPESHPEDIKIALKKTIDKGSDVPMQLHAAVWSENINRTEKLLSRFPIDFHSKDLSPPLFWACQLGLVPMVKFLLQNGADTSKRSRPPHNLSLITVAMKGVKPEIIRILLNHNSQTLPSQYKDITDCIIGALIYGAFESLIVLLQESLSKRDKNLLMHYLTSFFLLDIDIISPLIDWNYFKDNNIEKIYFMMQFGSPDRIHELAKPGGPLHQWSGKRAPKDWPRRLMSFAAQFGRCDLIEILMNLGILTDPVGGDINGVLPVLDAIYYCQINFLKKLFSLCESYQHYFSNPPPKHFRNPMLIRSTYQIKAYLHERFPGLVYTPGQDGFLNPIVSSIDIDDVYTLDVYNKLNIDIQSHKHKFKQSDITANMVEVAIAHRSFRCLDYLHDHFQQLFKNLNFQVCNLRVPLEEALFNQNLLKLLEWLEKKHHAILENGFLSNLLMANKGQLNRVGISILHFFYQRFSYVFICKIILVKGRQHAVDFMKNFQVIYPSWKEIFCLVNENNNLYIYAPPRVPHLSQDREWFPLRLKADEFKELVFEESPSIFKNFPFPKKLVEEFRNRKISLDQVENSSDQMETLARSFMLAHPAYIEAFQVRLPGLCINLENSLNLRKASAAYSAFYLHLLFVDPRRGYHFLIRILNLIFEYSAPENETENQTAVRLALLDTESRSQFINKMAYENYCSTPPGRIFDPLINYSEEAIRKETELYLKDTAKEIAELIPETISDPFFKDNLYQDFLEGKKQAPNLPSLYREYAKLLGEEWRKRFAIYSTTSNLTELAIQPSQP